MRLRPRRSFRAPLKNASSHDVAEMDDPGTDMPLKAHSLLGTKKRVDASREDLGNSRRAEHKTLGTAGGAQEAGGDTTSSAKYGTSNRLPSDAWETTSYSDMQGVRQNSSSTGVQTHQFYSEQHPSFESARREYYDSSKQPLYVSQQTSASAVRDMGLRKGSPTITAKPTKHSKAAVHNEKPDSRSKGADGGRKPRRLDFASLFSRPTASSARVLSPAKLSHSPSAMTDAFDFFPEETVTADAKTQERNGRLETQKHTQSPSLRSSSINTTTTRQKVFDHDIYDHKKTHQHRPPKGIQNWFDDFNISSDEEDQQLEKPPVDPPKPSVEEVSPGVSPHGSTRRTNVNGNGGFRSPQENLRATAQVQEVMRRRMQEKNSDTETLPGSVSSAAVPGSHVYSSESRLAQSRLESHSILSLSDSEDDGKEFSHGRKSSEANPLRETPGSQDFRGEKDREIDGNEKTSPSVAIRVTHSKSSPSKRDRGTAHNRSESERREPDRHWSGKYSSDRRLSNSPQSKSVASLRGDRRSAAGETVSSAVSDASRVMAVTEEEMALLELMRKKRAAMANNSFAEGYRLALKQEEDHLAQRRSSAQSTALQGLKEKEREEISQNRSRGNGKTHSMLSEDQQQRARYSMIRKGSVDKEFKLGRFLDAVAAQEDDDKLQTASVAKMERFLVMKPSLLDAIQDHRPLSGTEIEADSMTEQEEDFLDGYTYTTDEEEATVADDGAAMERLARMARAPQPEDDFSQDESAEEERRPTRAISTSRSQGDDANITALPRFEPSSQPMSLLSDPISEEEEETDLVSQFPQPSPRISDSKGFTKIKPPEQAQSRSRQPHAQVETAATRPTKAKSQDPNQTPSRDFTPLDLPSGKTGSPSMSTSRPSPLTPTFPPGTIYEKNTPDIADNGSLPSYPPSPDPNAAFGMTHMHSTNGRRVGKKQPPRIETAREQGSRVTSMASISSAGEDVLAAWAELGGGSDAAWARRRGR